MAIKMFTLPDKDVANAGDAEAIHASNLYVLAVEIQAKNSNTGAIYVGDSNVSATQCKELQAGQSHTMDGYHGKPGGVQELNLNDIYIDSEVDGEGVHIVYQLARPTT